MEKDSCGCKIKDLESKDSALSRYIRLTHGSVSWWRSLRNELVVLLFGNIPGALGLGLRKFFYRGMFKKCGRGVIFGRGVSFRHACKIELGDGCIIDDGAMVDAKGDTNEGITFGEGVYIGRNSTVYCKNGDISLGAKVNVSSSCTLFSSNNLAIGAGCMIGAYSYILSGGEYDYRDQRPFASQSGMGTKGPLTIGSDSWIGARVTVLDGAGSIGERCVIAACALVTRPVASRSLVAGVPAKVIKKL